MGKEARKETGRITKENNTIENNTIQEFQKQYVPRRNGGGGGSYGGGGGGGQSLPLHLYIHSFVLK
jgi:hypothetical protein